MDLDLGRVSKLAHFAADSPIYLFDGEIEEGEKPWVAARQSSAQFSLAILFRDPGEKIGRILKRLF